MNNTVQTIEAEEKQPVTKDANYWHQEAVAADKDRSNSSLRHCEAIYNIKQDQKYKILGHSSIHQYVFENFGKSKQWTDKLVAIHQRFVVELGKSREELQEIGFGKLSKLVSVVDENNADTILEEAKDLSQKEIDDKIRESKGLQENEESADEEFVVLRIKMPREVKEVYDSALEDAKIEYQESQDAEVKQEFQALEMILANYMLSRIPSGSGDEQIEDSLNRFADKHGILVTWDYKDE